MTGFLLLEKQSLTERAVRQIEEMTRPDGGIYKPGARLPSEREMAASMGISRPTLREALAVLIVGGVLERKPGSGTYVRRQRDASAAAMLTNMEMLSEEAPFQVLEARKHFEPESAALAALRAGPEDLTALGDLLTKMDEQLSEGGLALALDCEFHVAIAGATQNPIVHGVVRYLCLVWFNTDSPWTNSKLEGLQRPTRLNYIRKTHREVFEAIDRHDTRGARSAMRRHLERVLQS